MARVGEVGLVFLRVKEGKEIKFYDLAWILKSLGLKNWKSIRSATECMYGPD